MSGELPPKAMSVAETLVALEGQRRAFEERPVVRRMYREWFDAMAERLALVDGPTIELGAGSGLLGDHLPEIVVTDVIATPWAERVVDAERLPFDDGSVANLLMVDVLHHVPRPADSLREADRVLAPGGRMILLEPYCGALSGRAYRRLHFEDLDMDADLEAAAQSSAAPLDANIAVPTIVFWRRFELLVRWAPRLRVLERRRLAWLAYPLSGGFTRKPLLPERAFGALEAIDRRLAFLFAPALGFRCLVTLEKERLPRLHSRTV